MATADKLNYLLETKAKLKNAINDDISLINENTIFREYPNKISSLSDRLKSYIPTGIKTGASIQVNDTVPLNVKSLAIDGNSYQKTTKGINLFNYLENINNISGLTITADGDYIVVNGTTVNNYQLLIKDVDLTDVLEDGEKYTIWQENDDKSFNSDTFPKAAIRVRAKHINGAETLTRTSSSKFATFSVDKSIFEKYLVDVVTPTSGEIYSDYKNKFMLIKGEYDDNTIPSFEPYTNGISPNPDYPQNVDVIDSVKIINRSDQLVDFSKFVVLADGTTSSFENDVLSVSSANNRYNRIGYDVLDVIKNNRGKMLCFAYDSYDFSNGNNAIVQIKYTVNESVKYKTLLNDSENKYSFSIPENIDNITSAELEIFSNNTGTNIQSSISITKPMLQFGMDKLEYGKYHKDEYSIDLQGNFIAKINDVKDTLDLSTGILTKKIGLKILNGTENWVSTSAYDGYYRYSLEPIDENLKSDNVIGMYSLNTHFYNRNKENHGDYEYLYVQANSSSGIIYIQSKKWATITEFKEWLLENNVIVCYELATSQTIQLEPVKIKMHEGANNIELISNLETSMTLEYYKDYKVNSEVVSEVIG